MHSFEIWLQFDRERRTGKYAACKYPNLVEIFDYFPTYYFAKVTDELMLAVFRGEEDLTLVELERIAYYNHIPFSVLACPKRITLSRENRRHGKMIDELYVRLQAIEVLQKKGSVRADDYLNRYASTGVLNYTRMVSAFRSGQTVTYGHYLGVKHQMSNAVSSAQNELRPGPRGLRRANHE